MNTFNGIPISDYRVLVHSIIFSILFLVLMIAFGFWLYISLTMKKTKERQRLRKLKEQAQTNETARRQLERIERKNKRRRQRNKDTIIADILVWSLTVCLATVILAWGVIPGWTDYIKKDYAVYTGEITVYNQMRRWK